MIRRVFFINDECYGIRLRGRKEPAPIFPLKPHLSLCCLAFYWRFGLHLLFLFSLYSHYYPYGPYSLFFFHGFCFFPLSYIRKALTAFDCFADMARSNKMSKTFYLKQEVAIKTNGFIITLILKLCTNFVLCTVLCVIMVLSWSARVQIIAGYLFLFCASTEKVLSNSGKMM